jgi:hypothetical protein
MERAFNGYRGEIIEVQRKQDSKYNITSKVKLNVMNSLGITKKIVIL